jgi:hypothetical protein
MALSTIIRLGCLCLPWTNALAYFTGVKKFKTVVASFDKNTMFSSSDSSEAEELSGPVPGNESARRKNQSNQSPGANVIKLFTAASYDFS